MKAPRRPRTAACLLAALLAGCASPPPTDYTEYLAHMPRSILVLPPVNDSIEAEAGSVFLATVTRPLAELGYYVFPIAVVEAFLRQNGRPTPADMHAIEPAKLREVFGADAVLYIHIKQWGSSYAVIASTATVATECRLVDLHSGIELWRGQGAAVESSAAGGGDPIGLLATALVSQIVSAIDDPCTDLACRANQGLFADPHDGLLLGHRHPRYAEDQAARRAAAAPPR